MNSEIQRAELEDEYYHVIFKDPDNFDEIRTPDWASEAAQSVSEGSKIRMGLVKNTDDWTVQSILIGKTVGEEKAKEQALEIRDKVES